MIPCRIVSTVTESWCIKAHFKEESGVVSAEARVYILDMESEGAVDD